MRRVWTLIGLAASALVPGAAAARPARTAAPQVGEVTALSVLPAAGRAEVVIAIDGPAPMAVRDFTLAHPNRIVVDLTGARLALSPMFYDQARRGAITNVRAGQFRDNIVRIVLELDGTQPYTVTRGDGEVRISVDGASRQFAAWHSDEAAAIAAGDIAAAPDVTATTRTAAERPVYDTPVQAVPATTTAAVPAPRRLTRADTRAVSNASASAASAQARITVTYQDAEIRDVIAAFAVFSGRTIVVGKTVKGSVSAEIHDQPWDVALRAILQTQGLAAREDANGIILVDSYENIAAQQATEPMQTEVIPVNYAKAASLVSTVEKLLSRSCGGVTVSPAEGAPAPAASGGKGKDCVTRGSVTVDSATNQLVVQDVPARIADVRQYVKQLDIRTPQVAIKAKIIFVDRTSIQDIGVAYDLGSGDQFFNKLVQRPDPSTFSPTDTNGDGVPDALTGKPFNPNTNVVNIGGNALSAIANANSRVVQPALQLVFSTALGKFNLTTFLDALQETRLADLQAEPSVVTLDNREATILSGEETPIRVIDLGSQASGAANQAPRATVQFKETGIILRVTPQITNNRQVLMTVHAERSNLQPAASDLGFTFQKQSADNRLLVNDGETAVIGGLTVTQVQQSRVGIPILVDLPFVGRLFGETRTEEEKRDLLILITPHIVDEGETLGPPGGDR